MLSRCETRTFSASACIRLARNASGTPRSRGGFASMHPIYTWKGVDRWKIPVNSLTRTRVNISGLGVYAASFTNAVSENDVSKALRDLNGINCGSITDVRHEIKRSLRSTRSGLPLVLRFDGGDFENNISSGDVLRPARASWTLTLFEPHGIPHRAIPSNNIAFGNGRSVWLASIRDTNMKSTRDQTCFALEVSWAGSFNYNELESSDYGSDQLRVILEGNIAKHDPEFLSLTEQITLGPGESLQKHGVHPRRPLFLARLGDVIETSAKQTSGMSAFSNALFAGISECRNAILPGANLQSLSVNLKPRGAEVRSIYHRSFGPPKLGSIHLQSGPIPANHPQSRHLSTHTKTTASLKRAFVGIGSNVGDRLQLIEDAYRALRSHEHIGVTRTSGLWETKAMYVTDQGDFLNAVFELETTLEPHDFLDALHLVENSHGRERVIFKGPRTLDLDIILYENQVIASDRLVVPHPLMLERAFVLNPLCQLVPHERHPADEKLLTFADHLNNLPKAEAQESTLTPLSTSDFRLTPLVPTRRTEIMSILNITPDSFSDGGLHSASNVDILEKTIRAHIAAGATILDVGGQSSRPSAEPITAGEETARVVPVIQLIRTVVSSLPSDSTKPPPAISIDTYRSEVASAAVAAGADIINDISAGTLDAAMLPTVAALGRTVILTHMRSDPQNMLRAENTSYPAGVVPAVGAELRERVRAAEEAGVPRWRIVLDPGIGFAKNGEQNLELLKRFGELRACKGLEGLPWMVGASRKRFIGKATGVEEASERVWGTAATVAAAVQGGAEVVRVHDVGEMAQVARMSDAIWRV